jgi:hypothetical protein
MKFIELLEECDIPPAPSGHHHTTEGWIQFDCPFCGKDSGRYHMGYNISGGFVNCWKCGTHSIASVLHEYTGFPYRKIVSLVKQLDEVHNPPLVRENLKGFLELPPNVDHLKDAHIRYLSKRGFNYKEIQQLWQIKGISISNKLSWRLFIPIIYGGKVVSWTTRSLGNKGQRYISAKPEQELMPHKNILYGMDYVRNAAIIVEGPMDAWAVGPGAVATFGTAYTKPQILELIRIPKRVICYDSSEDAQKQASKLLYELGPFSGDTLNVILDAKDPAEAKASELKRLRKFLEK